MPQQQLTNPTGQEGIPWSTSVLIEEYLYDPTVTTATTGYANGLGLVNGTVVFLFGGYTYSTNTTSATVVSFGTGINSPGAVPVIRKSPQAGSVFGQIGVVINAPTGTQTGSGASPTVTGGYQPGQVVQVVTQGIAGCLCDANNVTFGQFAVAGVTTGGAATASATITTGKTVGVVLATTTIASNTALVPVYVNLQ